MKKTVLFILIALSTMSLHAQKLLSRSGHIWFYSKTSLEEIEADNREVASILNTQSGELQISMLIKSFRFKKALMEEHFNEDYMQSDKYPQSTFVGKITNISSINFKKDGTYPATVKGKLTMHNVTKEVTVTGKILVQGGKVTAQALFEIVPKDYNVTFPEVINRKIAKQIDVHVDIPYQNK